MSAGLTKMFGSPQVAPFSAVAGTSAGGGLTNFQMSQPAGVSFGASQVASPNSSALGHSLLPPVPVIGGSPVFQSPSGNKFPAGGGPIIFTPNSSAAVPSTVSLGLPGAAQTSPYNYPGRGMSSFVQSPPYAAPGAAGVASPSHIAYSSPPYNSTAIQSPGGHYPYHPGGGNYPVSPIAHGYAAPAIQHANTQPYGYGARAMSGSYAFHQSYGERYGGIQSPNQYVQHHSPRDETGEPMHCSPVGQIHGQAPVQYQQQLQRNPSSPPRAQYMPAFLTGVDMTAASSSRPRRVFERSPSSSPPAVGVGMGPGGKSPIKSQNWGLDSSAGQQTSYSASQGESLGAGAGGGMNRRNQGQGPSRQLRFNDVSNLQNFIQGTEEKEKPKPKRTGPPIHGFGSSEELSTFLNSPQLQENNDSTPGAAIAREAINKAEQKSPIAESNWITVFGFPSAAASFIYTHFAQFGPIIQSKCNPGGNWLHIQYTSRIDARRALSSGNGKVLGGTIMLGVITSPREVIEMYEKEKPEENTSPSNRKSPLQEKNFDMDRSTSGQGQTVTGSHSTFNESGKSLPARTGGSTIRPLAGTQSFHGQGGGDSSMSKVFVSSFNNSSTKDFGMGQTRQNENAVPLPTPSTGILTKALEYMFGW